MAARSPLPFVRPVELIKLRNTTGNVLRINLTIRHFRTIVVAVQKQEGLHILSACLYP